jgi:BTB/POZ domain
VTVSGSMGSEQQFCLRWNNFQNSLLASLPQLLDTNDLTDVTLCAGGKSIRAHRVVLSACSQYFKQLFRVRIKNNFLEARKLLTYDLKKIL